MVSGNSVHTPLSAGGRWGGRGEGRGLVGWLNLQPNFQKGGLDRTPVLEGVSGKEEVTFFRGVAIFT